MLFNTDSLFDLYTRNDAQLDHVLTNLSNEFLSPVSLPPFGRSDYLVVFCPVRCRPLPPKKTEN